MIEQTPKAFTEHEKYIILKNHFHPSERYEFKKTFNHGCYRSCKREHLSDCFVYSPQKDGVFCIYCVLFLSENKKRSLGSFVNKGYIEWHNIKEKESRHSGNNYHQQAIQEAYGIIERFENPTSTVQVNMNNDLNERYQVYPKVVEALSRVVHLLGRQGLAFRGHRESLENRDKNSGNFLTLVQEVAHYYPLLKSHLEEPLRKDVKYLGPKSQNELIDIIGKRLIQKKLIDEIIEAGMHSVSADEVTASNDEILSICIRYVNKENEICEVFMEFIDLERITGECIGKAILKFYSDIGLDITECRGQCYDGAANMQSQKKGAAAFVLKESPTAIVTHCCSHNLNLSLAGSCKNPEIDNILETYKAVIIFFNTSPKRESLLVHVTQTRCIGAEKRKVLVGLCKTRWSERDISYEHFYLAIPFIVEALEIMNGTHRGKESFESVYKDGWDSKAKKEATSFLNAVTKFEFLIGLVSLYRLLHPLVGITQKLQGRSIDVVNAYKEVDGCIKDMEHVRENIDAEFKVIYQQAERMAAKVNVDPTIPRSAARQMHRNNVPADNPEEYYRRALAIPLIDKFVSEMSFRFNTFNKRASKLLLLIPSIICNSKEYESLDLDDLIKQYNDDLPNPDVVDLELQLWKRKWLDVTEEHRPDSLAKAIKECDKLKFPNVFTLIKIGCTLPVTSAECERSFSAMRRLRTWLRSTMKSERLSALAIMNIHYSVEVSYKEASQLFFTLYPRKIYESNLIFS